MASSEALPRHVAVIMDGNGRWARQNKLKIALGHRSGVEAVRGIIRETSGLGIPALSLFAFSAENWARPREEVNALMQLMLEFFTSEIEALDAENVVIRILGNKEGLPDRQREAAIGAEHRTHGNTGLRLNIALNYGSRQEIVAAAREMASSVQKGELTLPDMTEETFARYLYTRGLPDVDLLIRTSGEMRISNFMLFQCAYAEFYFTDTLWPAFTVDEYRQALAAYQHRDRRYGGRG